MERHSAADGSGVTVTLNPQLSTSNSLRLSRREVLKWFAAAFAAANLPEFLVEAQAAAPRAQGYGTDPNIAKFYNPGDFWPLTFTPAQRSTATALADVILPADHLGPAASAVRVPDYLDEWVSAPYPAQQLDREIILAGLQWLVDEATKRFQKSFSDLTAAQQQAICDDICGAVEPAPPLRPAANFFRRFRSLAASAYYGTEAGWKALGYVGNVPLAAFAGPPPEVLAKLGVEQTVK
ncbi:MAG: gluconate 2-dehydrogenase subunit 3 family protein [Opitutus sp.]|nr:gluconate 2-dehydrogenase subunit 3 family protein [Opitutus sp.]